MLSHTESIDTVPIRVLGRSHLACVRCRTQKTKCDGDKPTCKTCALAKKDCFYEFKDRKIILLESLLNRLQDRIKYLESKTTTSSSKKPISVKQELDDHYHFLDSSNSVTDIQQQETEEEDADEDISGGYLNQQYPIFPNPLFGNPDNFNQDFLNPSEKQRVSIDRIFVDPKPTDVSKTLENSTKNLFQFDYALLDCLGEFAYFDSVNPTVSNLHQNSKHYLSDNYFDYPFNGYITLPERKYTLEIFDKVYAKLCGSHYLYDKQDFLDQVEKVYHDLSAQTSSFLSKLLITLAIGEQIVFSQLSFDPKFTERYGDRLNNGVAGLKFFTLAIQLFRYNHEDYSFSNIQTCCLIGYYEQTLNRLTSLHCFYGLAFRYLISNGYHRVLKYVNLDPVEKEKGKRLWWTVYNMTVFSSAKLHIPLAVDYLDTDVDLPLENFVDIGDGFKIEYLDAELKLCRYLNFLVRNFYIPSTRTFQQSKTSFGNPQLQIQEKIEKTLYILGELERVRHEISPFFQRLEMNVFNGSKVECRDDLNLVMLYHCVIIFSTRPLVLSFFRGLIPENENIKVITGKALDSACELIKFLNFLKDSLTLQTFDFWDNQYCFASLLILTVAKMSGIETPSLKIGLDLMIFMANSGNHSARAYFEKLITLEQCILSSGKGTFLDKPLVEMTNYPSAAKTKALLKDNDKILVKTENLSLEEKRSLPRKITRKTQAKSQQQYPQSFSPAPSNFKLKPPMQAQRTVFKNNRNSSNEQLSLDIPRESAMQNFKMEAPLNFNADPEFFNDLVSNIQTWDNPFTPDFILTQNQLQQQQQASSQANQNYTGVPVPMMKAVPQFPTNAIPELNQQGLMQAGQAPNFRQPQFGLNNQTIFDPQTQQHIVPENQSLLQQAAQVAQTGQPAHLMGMDLNQFPNYTSS